MSNRYKGGVISATPPTLVAGAGASGTWTLEQQMQANAAGLWPTNGPFYIEDVFSTWLYSGTSAAQTITNGIDLAGKGGLVWSKGRNLAGYNNCLMDTARSGILFSDTTQSANDYPTDIQSYNSNGFTLKAQASSSYSNIVGTNYASWTFREQPKFFDVVTYTGDGVAGRTVPHNLGSVPGCMIIKVTSTSDNWAVYHRSLGAAYHLRLNATSAATDSSTYWNNTNPTSTEFTVGTPSEVNTNGATYVAYLFAHNAGGFGLSGTDNVISCGSFTTDGSGIATIDLGYEPQWVMFKASSGTGGWNLYDNMRGWSLSTDATLRANTSAAESSFDTGGPTATGFTYTNAGAPDFTFIYIAIRRGPMKVPTSGTSVFTPYQVPASPTTGAITGFVTDAGFIGSRAGSDKFLWGSRLTGNPTLNSTNTNAESANTNQIWDRMNGWWNTAINNYMTWGVARAPGFFDVVCYTGTGGSNQSFAHNLGVVPELVIYKSRSAAGNWPVWSSTSALGSADYLRINTTAAKATFSLMSSSPSSSLFYVASGNDGSNNGTGTTYVAYLFASAPGVSKVGSYTGTGTTQTINCGFTGGARFVMIKRTDSTGDWYVWDTARGMIPANDPYLLMNSTAAEVTSTDFVDTAATGFEISSTAPAAINASGGTFIFLAIA